MLVFNLQLARGAKTRSLCKLKLQHQHPLPSLNAFDEWIIELEGIAGPIEKMVRWKKTVLTLHLSAWPLKMFVAESACPSKLSKQLQFIWGN